MKLMLVLIVLGGTGALIKDLLFYEAKDETKKKDVLLRDIIHNDKNSEVNEVDYDQDNYT